MTLLDIRFPSTDGLLVTRLKAALTGWNPVWVATVLPDTKTRRMVTVRDDSGPQEGVLSRRRYGFNVWADSRVDAEKVALDAMAGLRRTPGAVTDQFSGPYEINDDTPYTVPVSGTAKVLSHYYFSCRVSVKGTNA